MKPQSIKASYAPSFTATKKHKASIPLASLNALRLQESTLPIPTISSSTTKSKGSRQLTKATATDNP